MASAITDRVFFKGRRWEFTLNPGPFNVKEHVLITIFANSGAGNVYAIHLVSAVKVFYKKNMTFLVALLVVITTQVLGFGWAGLFRRYLVEPAAMWWPQNLVQVSLFRYVLIVRPSALLLIVQRPVHQIEVTSHARGVDSRFAPKLINLAVKVTDIKMLNQK